MELENKEWKEFFIEDIFKIKSGKRLTKADMKDGKMPFIGATDSNNGITEFISNKNSSSDKNVLGVNYNGSVVHNFYHPYQALFSDDVKRLIFKHINGNKYLFLFIKTVILQQKSKYEYGYKFNGTRMKRQKILLPINENGNPDYTFMENYMREKESKFLAKYQSYISSKIKHFKEQTNKKIEWKEFIVKDVFKIKNSKAYHKTKLTEVEKDGISYVSRTNLNNGVDAIVKNENFKINKANTIAFGAENATFFYQPNEYITGNKMYYIESFSLNKFTALFIQVSLNKSIENCGFGYGKGLTGTRMKRRKILLPINTKGNPDFEYMENYIKRIEQEKLLKYINHKQLNIS